MTIKDWVSLALLVLALVGVVIQAGVAMALRERDREDFKDLEKAHNDLRKEHEQLAREVSGLGRDRP